MAHKAYAEDISGTVYREYDYDGVQNTFEPGIAGVTVQAYDINGVVANTALTSPDGSYTLTGLDLNENYRIEFVNFPSFYTAAPVGANSSTTTAFQVAPATGVDLGLGSAEQYCQDDPEIATPIARPLDVADNTGSIYSFNYSDSGQLPGATGVNPVPEATYGQTGTVYGLAYCGQANILMAAAQVKRHAELGPGDGAGSNPTGSIYSIPNPLDGSVELDSNVSEFVNLNDYGDTGTLVRSDLTLDLNTYTHTGRMGIGQLVLANGERTLYATNLFDRQIYKLPLGADATNPVAPAPADVDTINLLDTSVYAAGQAPDCNGAAAGNGLNQELRPNALTFHDGRIFVGMVCSGENGNPLKAAVYSFDESSAGLLELATEFDLDFNRGCGLRQLNGGGAGCLGGQGNNSANWNAWTSDGPDANSLDDYPPVGSGTAFQEIWYPQPMLSGIAFGSDNEMIIAFRDRWGDQMGHNQLDPNGQENPPNANIPDRGDAFGDILRVTENTASQTDFTWDFSVAEATAGTEFFSADSWTDGNFTHEETVQGNVVTFPAIGTVMTAVMDPFRDWSAGTDVYNLADGTIDHSYEIMRDDSTGSTFFGKSSGIGTIEPLCDLPPIEVGNRVWLDIDNNGVQDPDEQPIAGVTVQLIDTDGVTVLATALTDVNGEFYFSSATNTDTQSRKFGLPLLANTNGYEFRIDTTSEPVGANNYVLTTPNFGSNDQADSDANLVGNNAVVVVNTSDPGTSDHTFDFGFTLPKIDLQISKTVNPSSGVRPGDPVVYTITVSNTSDVDATNVEITDPLPAMVSYQSQGSSATLGSLSESNGLVTWDVGTLAAQSSAVMTIAVIVN